MNNNAKRRALSSIIKLTLATVLITTGLATAGPAADAVDTPTPMEHTIDYVLVSRTTNTGFLSTTDLETITQTVSDSWARMSRGMIAKMTMGKVVSLPEFSAKNLCHLPDDDLLTSALGNSSDIYNGLPNGHDLIVIGAGSDTTLWTCGDWLGVTVKLGQGFASGGAVIVRSNTVAGTAATIIHEVGHTFGLEHATSVPEKCNTQNWDGPFVNDNFTQRDGFCSINLTEQYRDVSNVMANDFNPATVDLNGRQKEKLGLIRPGSGLIEATASASEQLFTIHDAHTSDLSLPQSVRLTADAPDTDMGCTAPVYNIDYDPALGGVRVYHVVALAGCGTQTLDPDHAAPDTIAWIAAGSFDTGRMFFLPGESQMTASGRVQIKVISADPASGTATISIRRTDVPGFSSLQVTSRELAASASVVATGKLLSGMVTTNQDSWSATSDQSWVTATDSGTTGQYLVVSVDRNMTAETRVATITVRAGTETRTFTVTQDGGDPSIDDDCGATLTSYCTLAVTTPVTHALETAGDHDLFKVTAAATGWYGVVAPYDTRMESLAADGTTMVPDSGMPTVYLDAGQSCFFRVYGYTTTTTTTYTVTLNFERAGIVVSPSYLEVSPGLSHQTVTIRTEWDWVTGDSPFVTASPSSGSGNATVELTVAANTAGRGHFVGMTFCNRFYAGCEAVSMWQPLPLGNGPVAPALAVAPDRVDAPGSGDTQAVQLTAPGDWQRMDQPGWVNTDPHFGTGNASVKLTTAPNTTGEPRTGTVTYKSGDEVVALTVTQPAVRDDCGDTASSGCRWDDLSIPLTGTLDYGTDKDWYEFTAPVTGRYVFSGSGAGVKSAPNVGGLLYRTDGSDIAYAYSNGGPYQFTFGANLAAGETYYLEVRGRSLGDYLITATIRT